MVYHTIYSGSTIQGGAGFLPFTVHIYIYIEYIICVCTGIMEYIDMLVKDNPYQNHIYILMEYDVKSINNNNK